MKERIKKFFFSNYLIFGFVAIALIIELVGVLVTSGRFYILNPWLYLSVLLIFTIIAYTISSNNARYICCSVFLSLIFAADLVFIVIYDLTGTIFDFSMFLLRKDAMAIVEKIPVDFLYAAVGGVLISLFIVFGRVLIPFAPQPAKTRLPLLLKVGGMVVVLACHVTLVFYSNRNVNTQDLNYKLYARSSSSYSDRGILGNFFNELYKGLFFDNPQLGDPGELKDFIFEEVSEPTEYFGKAEGYNVVTILGETLEWFCFVADNDRFPNGFKADEATLREIYPNLYKFYDESIVMNNFHSREKTDISENLSIIGSYPLRSYINYDFPTNALPFGLPDILKNLDGVVSRSYHNGDANFYNRAEHHENALGFEEFSSSEKIEARYPDTFHNYMDRGERNLDSEMIEACKEEMFPADRRFNTYITTITMHGQYAYRENLAPYYDVLDAYGLLPLQSGNSQAAENANAMRCYAAAAMELDKALGVMTDYLEEKGIADKTMIVLFGDHNAYYQSLSNYVKDIYSDSNGKNYTELYRVPFMVKVGGQPELHKVVDKFTCTADILPTILDLLGIRYYSNLYYGHSALAERASILYSRAYDIFMTDKMFFSNLANVKYKSPDVDEAYLEDVEDRALELLNKISHANRIFNFDFMRGKVGEAYNEGMKQLQTQSV